MRPLIAAWCSAVASRLVAIAAALRTPAAVIEYSDRVADVDHCMHRMAMARTPDDAHYWGAQLARSLERLDAVDARRIAAERARHELITTGGPS